MKTYLQFLEGIDDGVYTFRRPNYYTVEYLCEWMRENRIPNPVPSSELHATVVCSRCSIPGYVPDSSLVMLNPASYRVQMLNQALVISFKSDPLEEQWQRAMNLGAQTQWPTYLPHITLSYKVPTSFDYTDLKPPPTFMVLGEEECRKMVEGWASVNALREDVPDSHSSSIYVPQTTLNVPQSQMPQISSADTMDFVDWIESQGIVVQYLDVPVSILRSVQDEIDLKRVASLVSGSKDKLHKPLIISKDDYILDGHHRWLAILNRDPHFIVAAYRIDRPIKELLKIAQTYEKAFFRQPQNPQYATA